jgi:hypothetical protein
MVRTYIRYQRAYRDRDRCDRRIFQGIALAIRVDGRILHDGRDGLSLYGTFGVQSFDSRKGLDQNEPRRTVGTDQARKTADSASLWSMETRYEAWKHVEKFTLVEASYLYEEQLQTEIFKLAQLSQSATFPSFQHVNDITNLPKPLSHTSRHCRRCAKRLMNAHKIVIHEVQCHRVSVVFHFLWNEFVSRVILLKCILTFRLFRSA